MRWHRNVKFKKKKKRKYMHQDHAPRYLFEFQNCADEMDIRQPIRPSHRQKASSQQYPGASNPAQSATLPTKHRYYIFSPSPRSTSPPISHLPARPQTCETRRLLKAPALANLYPGALVSSFPRCGLPRLRFRVLVRVACKSGSACLGNRRDRRCSCDLRIYTGFDWSVYSLEWELAI